MLDQLPCGGLFFGDPILPAGLAPLKVGKNRRWAYCFQAQFTGPLTRLGVPGLRANRPGNPADEPGEYSEGNPDLVAHLVARAGDWGDFSKFVQGPTLATSAVTQNLVDVALANSPAWWDFPSPPFLYAGRSYAAILDIAPGSSGYVAINNHDAENLPDSEFLNPAMNGPYRSRDWFCYYDEGSGWHTRRTSNIHGRDHIMCFEQLRPDGTPIVLGKGSNWAGDVKVVGGTGNVGTAYGIPFGGPVRLRLRQEYPAPFITHELVVGAWRTAGTSSPLICNVRRADGSLVQKVTFPAEQFPAQYPTPANGETFKMPAASLIHTLAASSQYWLDLSCQVTGAYATFGNRPNPIPTRDTLTSSVQLSSDYGATWADLESATFKGQPIVSLKAGFVGRATV